MSSITTHILDTSLGNPATAVPVALLRIEAAGAATPVAEGKTDTDGRIVGLTEGIAIEPGVYRLRFDTAAYFAQDGRESFYPSVEVTFRVADAGAHYHVPLLISPFGYSTYRGS
ncbi:MAG: hydroxyisourate hydrolase [Planctomycetota bacterium]